MKGLFIRKLDLWLLFSGVVPLFMLAHFGHHVVSAMLRPLMPMIRTDLDLSYAQAGIVMSAFAITSGISQLPAGWLADRSGPRVMVVMGIVTNTRMPTSEAYIVMHTPERRRSTILGFYFFAGAEIAGLLTPVMGSLIDRFGFYRSFTIASVTLTVVAVCVCCFCGETGHPIAALCRTSQRIPPIYPLMPPRRVVLG